MIVNNDSRVIDKLETSLTDEARVVTYDHHMFIVQATDVKKEQPNKLKLIEQHLLDTNAGK
jgi:hypothetical protein